MSSINQYVAFILFAQERSLEAAVRSRRNGYAIIAGCDVKIDFAKNHASICGPQTVNACSRPPAVARGDDRPQMRSLNRLRRSRSTSPLSSRGGRSRVGISSSRGEHKIATESAVPICDWNCGICGNLVFNWRKICTRRIKGGRGSQCGGLRCDGTAALSALGKQLPDLGGKRSRQTNEEQQNEENARKRRRMSVSAVAQLPNVTVKDPWEGELSDCFIEHQIEMRAQAYARKDVKRAFAIQGPCNATLAQHTNACMHTLACINTYTHTHAHAQIYRKHFSKSTHLTSIHLSRDSLATCFSSAVFAFIHCDVHCHCQVRCWHEEWC